MFHSTNVEHHLDSILVTLMGAQHNHLSWLVFFFWEPEAIRISVIVNCIQMAELLCHWTLKTKSAIVLVFFSEEFVCVTAASSKTVVLLCFFQNHITDISTALFNCLSWTTLFWHYNSHFALYSVGGWTANCLKVCYILGSINSILKTITWTQNNYWKLKLGLPGEGYNPVTFGEPPHTTIGDRLYAKYLARWRSSILKHTHTHTHATP